MSSYLAVDGLFSLARHNRLKEVPRALDEHGFDIDVADAKGNTLLCVAAQNGLKRMAKLALRMGADLDHQNGIGNTPLHFCCAFGFAELAGYFISKGADPMLRNHVGVLCTEGLGKDALRLVNKAIAEAQEMGMLDETAQQHEWKGKGGAAAEEDGNNSVAATAALQDQYEGFGQEEQYGFEEQYAQEEQYAEEEQQYGQEEHYAQEEQQYGQEDYSVAAEQEQQQPVVVPLPLPPDQSASSQPGGATFTTTAQQKWRPLPKGPKPRPLPKGPRPTHAPNSAGTRLGKVSLGGGVVKLPGEGLTWSQPQKVQAQRPRSLPKLSLEARKSLELKKLRQIAVEREKKRMEKKEAQQRQQKSAARLSPLAGSASDKAATTEAAASVAAAAAATEAAAAAARAAVPGHGSVLQAVHAQDLGAVQSMLPPRDGEHAAKPNLHTSGYHAKQHDIDAATHAAGLSGQAKMLAELMPLASQKSLDRAIIAATARRHHLIVEYILCQRKLAGEAAEEEHGDGTHTNVKDASTSLKYFPALAELLAYRDASGGAQVSQSAIDRALVRAAAIELVDEDFERRKSQKMMHGAGGGGGGGGGGGNRIPPPPLSSTSPSSLSALKDARDSAFRRLMSVATVPATDRAFCSVAASGGGKGKARMLLPSVSLRGRRSGLLTAAATGNGEVLHLTLCAILEADAASNTGTGDSVRAKLRQKARFATMARAMEGAAARGHEECCIQLWELCDETAQTRALAAAKLNGHHGLIDLLKGGTEVARY